MSKTPREVLGRALAELDHLMKTDRPKVLRSVCAYYNFGHQKRETELGEDIRCARIAKIRKVGGSLVVTIPLPLAKVCTLSAGDAVELDALPSRRIILTKKGR